MMTDYFYLFILGSRPNNLVFSLIVNNQFKDLLKHMLHVTPKTITPY